MRNTAKNKSASKATPQRPTTIPIIAPFESFDFFEAEPVPVEFEFEDEVARTGGSAMMCGFAVSSKML